MMDFLEYALLFGLSPKEWRWVGVVLALGFAVAGIFTSGIARAVALVGCGFAVFIAIVATAWVALRPSLASDDDS